MEHRVALPPDAMGKVTYVAPAGQYSLKVCPLNIFYCLFSSVSVGRSFSSPLFHSDVCNLSYSAAQLYIYYGNFAKLKSVDTYFFLHSRASLYLLQYMVMLFLLFAGHCIGA
jgi:hypothetical protein